MKKALYIMLTSLLSIALAACSAPIATPTSSSVATQTSSSVATEVPAVVTFADPVLEAMIRGVMGKPEGDITVAEAEAVTWLNLNTELQRYVFEVKPIMNISGLENFSNLESLDLSFHAITDISPLAGLTKLTSLSLGGTPVANITPLASLTNLKVLILSNCAVQDYNPLANLVNLEFLMLDNSTIIDVSPLTSLTSLKYLYTANTSINDYSPLSEIYPNLEYKDFIIASTLKELGFVMDDGSRLATYDEEDAYVKIHHSAWGPPPEEWVNNIILTSMYLEGGQKLSIGYYGDLDAYVFQMGKEGEPPMNYVYDDGMVNIGSEERERFEQMIRAAMDVVEGEDVLLAPIHIFNDTIQRTFNMTADALYAMPYEPPTLKSLGFVLEEATGTFLFEQREGRYTSINLNRSEGEEKEYGVRFYTPFNDYYLIVTYDPDRQFFHVAAGKSEDELSFACFDYFLRDNSRIDTEVSEGITVEEYLRNMYNDPGIEDVYHYSIQLMQQYISDTFGMTIEELYALPTGE